MKKKNFFTSDHSVGLFSFWSALGSLYITVGPACLCFWL